MNKLWFGDNLTILREEIADESIDLVYLDPPFNSQANYNVLFRTPDDEVASAQVEAFRDTWTWGPEAEWAFEEIMRTGGGVTSIIYALRSALGESDMMAYLVMMAQRLHELRRVLKPTGSLYLHCDSTASHYLKIILDAIFGPKRFLNEITWRRTSAHNDGQRYGRIQDRLLFYSKTAEKKFRHVGGEYSPEQRARYRHQENGRWYKAENLTAPHYSPTRTIEWRGTHPGKNRQWRFGEEELERLWEGKRILVRRDGRPRKDGLKEYLDENESPALQDLWTDIKRIGNTASERLGYPTQKPVALLKRVIEVSTDPDDVILDPFCGCGTAIAAAEVLGRSWIGIDVAFHAIRVIEDRLADMPGKVEYDLGGIPRDFASAARLAERDKYQFQWWANYLVGVQALKEIRKGPDRGIDGQMFFMNGPRGWGRVLTSVKGGQHIGAKDVREFKAVIGRENAEMGLFICLREPTREMRSEAASFGFVDTVHGHLPKLQIVSIESWFAGARPVLPSLGHLSRDYFRSPAKAPKTGKARRPDPNAPEFPFTFLGDKKSSVVHFNPAAVPRDEVEQAALL